MMAKVNGSSKRARLSKEVEEIKRMRDLNKLLKAGDMENALLSNSAKDSETLNEGVLDDLLSRANTYEHGTGKGLEVIERLTTSTGARVVKQKRVRIIRTKGRVKVRRIIHMKKGKMSKKRSR